ncbi:hypothetical protein C817_04908 [Dorea sp. 5-2]|nr:hypothetical protein C817_04908 [Dorea sp. 5-2]
MNNDINISLLSRDARKNGGFSMQEMGASIPIHMLQHVLDGILETVNLTENNKPKQEILSRLDDPEELGFSIRMNYDYAIQGSELLVKWVLPKTSGRKAGVQVVLIK